MKRIHTNLFALSVFMLAAILLASCGPAATPVPTAVPPTAVPPTAVPPTTTPEPVSLNITGAVNNELQLTESALRGMEVLTLTLEHPKKGATEYTGVRLNDLLNQAGVKSADATVTLTASDGFAHTLDYAAVKDCADCLIAFDPEAPGVYNAAMAGQSSKAWVKGLVSIAVAEPEPITLEVDGSVDNLLKLTDSSLQGMEVITLTLEKPKQGSLEFTGVRLLDLLNQAGIKAGASMVTFTASDGFSNDLDIAAVQACADCLVAFDPENPGVYNLAAAGQTSGKAWVSGLTRITVK